MSAAPEPDLTATTSTRKAWQKIMYRDVVGFTLTYDTTQITWNYNGSCSQGGSVQTYFYGWTANYWFKYSSSWYVRTNTCALYEGSTSSDWYNNNVCKPFPVVWTYYYYNRVGGHPNGTATVGWSYDSINECFPIFDYRSTGYGQF